MGEISFCADVEWLVFSWEVRDRLWDKGFGYFLFFVVRSIMDVFRGFAFGVAETVAGQGCIMGAIAVALRGDRGLEREKEWITLHQ